MVATAGVSRQPDRQGGNVIDCQGSDDEYGANNQTYKTLHIVGSLGPAVKSH
jgi:hypothetical protein